MLGMEAPAVHDCPMRCGPVARAQMQGPWLMERPKLIRGCRRETGQQRAVAQRRSEHSGFGRQAVNTTAQSNNPPCRQRLLHLNPGEAGAAEGCRCCHTAAGTKEAHNFHGSKMRVAWGAWSDPAFAMWTTPKWGRSTRIGRLFGRERALWPSKCPSEAKAAAEAGWSCHRTREGARMP